MNRVRIVHLGIIVATLGSASFSIAAPAGLQVDSVMRQALYHQSRASIRNASAIQSSRTLQASSMRQLIKWTAPVSRSAPVQYGNDFARYWLASNRRSQRLGNTLEAVLAWRANEQYMRQAMPSRILVTAAEGYRTHGADLVEIAADGQELARYQVKLRLTLKSAGKHLANPKYFGMPLLTTRESHAELVEALAKKQANALRRGIELNPKWQRIADALENGRLPSTFGGRTLPTQRGLERLARKAASEQFLAHAATAEQISLAPSKLMRVARVGGRFVAVGDIALTGYLQYQDMSRYTSGKIPGDYLIAKSSLRGVQIILGTYTLISPEPISKAISGTLVVILVGVDAGIEVVQRRREQNAGEIMTHIDRDERFQAARLAIIAVNRLKSEEIAIGELRLD